MTIRQHAEDLLTLAACAKGVRLGLSLVVLIVQEGQRLRHDPLEAGRGPGCRLGQMGVHARLQPSFPISCVEVSWIW
jgi:hypothetical protein